MADIDYKLLASELLNGLSVASYKHTSPSGTPNAVMGHGRGGLFAHHALEKPVFSAMMLPIQGLQALLGAPKPTQTTDPLYGIITGVTAEGGSVPTGVCDDCQYAGLTKLCMHSATLGRYCAMTREFELDAFGKLQDRGDHMDLQLMNNPFGAPNGTNPTMPGGNPLQSDIAKGLFEFAVAWSRLFATQIYVGNPVNGNGAGYKEFLGLDGLINTGYVDAITNTVCPASDSYIKSFGNLDVSSQCAAIVRDITWIMRELRNRGDRTGLNPVRWAIAMRPMLFYLITECWPCEYLTYRCVTSSGNEATVDSTDAVNLRDAMRAGSYLLIDGQQVEVVQDDAIAETNVGAGVYSSQIYFVPLTVLGGTPVTYFEYFDYTSPNGFQQAAQTFAPAGFYDISDSGRFAWHKKPPTNWCVQMIVKTEPRLLLLTPFLAARLTNIRYTPVIHERDWAPAGTYFVNGGTSTGQPAPSYYPSYGFRQ